MRPTRFSVTTGRASVQSNRSSAARGILFALVLHDLTNLDRLPFFRNQKTSFLLVLFVVLFVVVGNLPFLFFLMT